MPFVQNIGKQEFIDGRFKKSSNCVLIQIEDPPADFAECSIKFNEIHQFSFLDVETEHYVIDPLMKVQYSDAKKIYNILKNALQNDRDVIVHCHAGVSRSGAVAEFAVKMGFEDKGEYRDPNRRLLEMLRFVEMEDKYGY